VGFALDLQIREAILTKLIPTKHQKLKIPEAELLLCNYKCISNTGEHFKIVDYILFGFKLPERKSVPGNSFSLNMDSNYCQ